MLRITIDLRKKISYLAKDLTNRFRMNMDCEHPSTFGKKNSFARAIMDIFDFLFN